MLTVPKIALTAVDQASPVINNVGRSVDRLTNRLGRSEGYLVRNRRAFQQVGFQVGDFATQIAGGQSAMLAFTQQGGQLLQFFGPLGAVVAGLVAVFGSFYIALDRAGGSLASLIGYFGVAQPAVSALGSSIAGLREIAFDTFNLLVNNIDRVLITATAAAAFFAGRWVASFVAARIATFSLIGALTTLRTLFLRFLPTAVFILIGELIYQFIRIVQGSESIGEAIKGLGGVVSAVFAGIRSYVSGTWKSIDASFTMMVANVLDNLRGPLVDAFYSFANGVGKAFVYINNLIPGGEKLRYVEQTFTGAIADLRGTANALNKDALADFNAATGYFRSANAQLTKLRGTADDIPKFDIRNLFGGGDDADGEGGAGGKLKDTLDNLKDKTDEFAQSVSSTLKGAFSSLFDSIFDGGKDAGKVLMDLGKSLLKLVAQTYLFRSLAGAFPGTFGSGGSIPLVSASAKGNVFQNGTRVTAFANGGIVSGPTMFPMKGGAGLMGEAGPEAIMPLTRGPGGRLGVQAMGGGGDTIQIINNTPSNVSYQSEKRDDGTTIKRFVIEETRKGMVRGDFDKAQRGRFGTAPQGIKR